MRGPPSSGNALRRRRIAQRRTDIPVPRGSGDGIVAGRTGVGQWRARMGRHSWTRTGGGARAAPGHGSGTSGVRGRVHSPVRHPTWEGIGCCIPLFGRANQRAQARAPLSRDVALNDGDGGGGDGAVITGACIASPRLCCWLPESNSESPSDDE